VTVECILGLAGVIIIFLKAAAGRMSSELPY